MADDITHIRFHLDENVDPGIAYCHIRSRTIRQIADALRLIHAVLTPDDVRGQVEYL